MQPNTMHGQNIERILKTGQDEITLATDRDKFDSHTLKYHDQLMNEENNQEQAGPTRQLLAVFYDAWLLAAVFMAASALTLPFTGGEPVKPGNPFMTTYILFVWYGFYAWFWTHGGQTLGMRSWKIKLVSDTSIDKGEALTLWHALLRFLTGIPTWLFIGIGSYLLMAEQPNLTHPLINALSKLPHGVALGIGCILLIAGNLKNSWRNRFSSTKVIQLAKSK